MLGLRSRLRSIPYGWWLLAAGFPILVYHAGTVSFSAGLLFKPLSERFGWSATTIGLAASLRRLEGGLIDPVVGFLLDRFGGRRLMIAGQAVIGGGLILLSQVHGLWQFYLAYLMISLGMSIGFFPTLSAMLVKWFDEKRGRVLGLGASATALGAAVLPLMAWLIERLGWRHTLLLAGTGALVLCLPLSLTMRDRPQAPERRPGDRAPSGAPSPVGPTGMSVREALRTPSFWLLGLIGGIFNFHNSSVTLLLIPHLQNEGFTPVVAGAAVTLSYVIATPGRLFFGWVGDYLDPRRVFVACLAMTVVGLVLLNQVSQFWHILFYALTYGWAFGGLISLQPLIMAETFGTRNFATIRGLTVPLSVGGGILGPLFATFIFDATGSYKPAFYALAGMAALAVPMALKLPTTSPRRAPATRHAAAGRGRG